MKITPTSPIPPAKKDSKNNSNQKDSPFNKILKDKLDKKKKENDDATRNRA